MRVLFIASVSQIALVAAAGLAPAQDRSNASPTAAPGVVIEGSSSTSVGGQSAARKGDRTDGGGAIIEGSKDVFINGTPAATTGDRTGCGGITVGGGGGVFINGKPAARAGDLTTGCANK